MRISQTNSRYRSWAAICALAAVGAPWTLVHAGKTLQELRAADPQGEVEIVNVSAWSRCRVGPERGRRQRHDRRQCRSGGCDKRGETHVDSCRDPDGPKLGFG